MQKKSKHYRLLSLLLIRHNKSIIKRSTKYSFHKISECAQSVRYTFGRWCW